MRAKLLPSSVLCWLLCGCASAVELGPSAPPAGATVTAVASAEPPPVFCPAGTRFDGTVCKAFVVIDCPAGTRFEEGTGCIALVPEREPSLSAQASASAPPPKPTTAAPAKSSNCGCAAGDLACSIRCAQKSNPQPPPPPSSTAAFDRSAASSALSSASASAKSCAKPGTPTASAKVTATYAPNGSIRSVSVGAPFANTAVGSCIAGVFRGSRIPAFAGADVTVSKVVIVP